MNSLTLNKKFPLSLIMHDTQRNSLQSRCFEIEITLYSVPEGDTQIHIEKAQLDQNLSFSKCQHFVEHILDSSWVYDLPGRDLVEVLIHTDLNFNAVLIPSMNEAALVTAIHAKLSTLCAETTVLDRVRLRDIREDLTYDFVSENGDISPALPSATEWLGKYSYWSTPWWNRYDITTYDNFADSVEEHEEWLLARDSENLLEEATRELNEIDEMIRETFYKNKPAAEVIELEFGKDARSN
jgi:hypothetical protein